MIRSHHLSGVLTVPAAIARASSADLMTRLKKAVQAADLTFVGEATADFTPQGASAVLILAESHVAIHVWAEHCKVTVDIHVCDYQQDNLPKAEQLAELLTEIFGTPSDRPQWHYLLAVG
jgi:S-adenosylmethionine/arginine decarboxylase-like enzyme